MTFVGLDLHKRYITACAIDADGTPHGEVGSTERPSRPMKVSGARCAATSCTTIVVAFTQHWATALPLTTNAMPRRTVTVYKTETPSRRGSTRRLNSGASGRLSEPLW
jgi:hypothetical protein